jgi:mono/diheme cytochrome c family protein
MSNSNHNPELTPAPHPDPVAAIQPDAPDFVETPEIAPLSSEKESLPMWLYLVCGFALFMAGSSFTGFGSFGRGLYDQGPGGVAMVNPGDQPPPDDTNPMAMGKKVYSGSCANCHQGTGMGQPGTYPPLVESPYVVGSKDRLAAILLKGLQGSVTVKGATYGTTVMPAQETLLTPDKIANLMTYIRGSWGNTANAVTPDEVTSAKAKFASHAAAWSEADLLKIAPDGPDPTDKKP